MFHQHRQEFKRWVPTFLSNHKTLFTDLWIVGFATVFVWQRNINIVNGLLVFRRAPVNPIPKLRPISFNLTDFGAVNDVVTDNTAAFERAISAIAKVGKKGGGGAQLNVGPGYWLTSPFNLTSHMTLFLAEDAVILGVDVGNNGTIDGQGQTWWKKYKQRLLNNTRGPLVQIMRSSDIVITNITLCNSPFWTLHPYDCKNVTIQNVTILAPVSGAPNTDGIDPDSCEDVLIENCYISVGDDGIAIKSGWDQYGISYAQPSTNILIRNLVVRSNVRSVNLNKKN